MTERDLEIEYERRLPFLSALAVNLQASVSDALLESQGASESNIDRIYFRAKDAESFLTKSGKLDPDSGDKRLKKYPNPLTQIEDQVGGRVLVFFRSDLERVGNCLVDLFGTIESVYKQPESATEFDYESHHYIFAIPSHLAPDGWATLTDKPMTFEMQVRTLFMHAWAEPQHNIGYKGDLSLDRNIKRQLAWISASAWGADHTLDRIWRRVKKLEGISGADEVSDMN